MTFANLPSFVSSYQDSTGAEFLILNGQHSDLNPGVYDGTVKLQSVGETDIPIEFIVWQFVFDFPDKNYTIGEPAHIFGI